MISHREGTPSKWAGFFHARVSPVERQNKESRRGCALLTSRQTLWAYPSGAEARITGPLGFPFLTVTHPTTFWTEAWSGVISVSQTSQMITPSGYRVAPLRVTPLRYGAGVKLPMGEQAFAVKGYLIMLHPSVIVVAYLLDQRRR